MLQVQQVLPVLRGLRVLKELLDPAELLAQVEPPVRQVRVEQVEHKVSLAQAVVQGQAGQQEPPAHREHPVPQVLQGLREKQVQVVLPDRPEPQVLPV